MYCFRSKFNLASCAGYNSNYYQGCIEMSANPCNWWRQHGAQFPLMNKFFIANWAFPATSTSSERAFSMDGLILIPQRRRLDPDITENLVICRLEVEN